jgi:uncharacterized membrane protein YkvA (DUF1232 family)
MRGCQRWRQWARTIKRDVLLLSLAAHDPRVLWYAKVVAACVAAYAFSPIDFIPNFIPVLGYLDDVIIVPLGIVLAIRLIPPALREDIDALPSSKASTALRVMTLPQSGRLDGGEQPQGLPDARAPRL